jgi:hypothetical protein
MGEQKSTENFVFVASRITNTNCVYEREGAFSTVVKFYLKYIWK